MSSFIGQETVSLYCHTLSGLNVLLFAASANPRTIILHLLLFKKYNLVFFWPSIRGKETWKGGESVKKILNGGGSLSSELIMYSTKFFPKAKLLSAYGRHLCLGYLFSFLKSCSVLFVLQI